MPATNPAGNKEYVSWPATVTPGRDTYLHHGTQADASTTVHSPRGWEWEEVTEGLDKLRAAIDLAQGVTRFTRIDTSQLRVTDTAFINEAVIQKIWTRVVTAEEGEFAKLKAGMIEAHEVVADQVRAGAIDGMTITGALIRTATSGARIELDTAGLRAYRPNGTPSFSINSSTGHVYVDGDIRRTDSWSYCAFADYTYEVNGRYVDTNTNGWKVGVGLDMNRLNNPARWAGALMLYERPDGLLQVSLRAPGDATYNAGSLPRVSLDEERVGLLVGPYKLTVGSDGLNASAPGADFTVDSHGLAFWFGDKSKDTTALWCGETGFNLRAKNDKDLAVWGRDGALIVGVDAHHYTQWTRGQATWSYGGHHIAGDKTFAARHPLHPDDQLLVHASTESPWDGIEYWGTLTLDDQGRGEALLPDYVPALHRRGAPTAVLLTTDHGTAHTTGWDRQSTTIPVTGEPGATVQWLLKAARVVDAGTPTGYTVPEPPNEGLWADALSRMQDHPLLYGTL